MDLAKQDTTAAITCQVLTYVVLSQHFPFLICLHAYQ